MSGLIALAGHTVDLNRLPDKAVVLDVGCRHFDFTSGILELRPGARVIALDPDPAIVAPHMDGCTFLRFALVHDGRTRSRYASYSTGEGNMLTDAESYFDAKMFDVPCTNIERLMRRMHIDHWDLVKLDCEGSEFGILGNWPGPIADQISVEFHDYDKPMIRNEPSQYYELLLFKRLRAFGYRVVQHEVTDISGREACGHWDTLLVGD